MNSRGLRLSLDLKNMKASVDLQVEHPYGEGAFAFRRGDMQVLPNDNILMGWSEHGLMSEHAPDGKLLMEGHLRAGWLGCYRAYKLPWVGEPAEAPVVAAVYTDVDEDHPITQIFASWNGATEVASWRAYGVNSEGESPWLIGTTRKTGFETSIFHRGRVDQVLVQALDREQRVLAEASSIRTSSSIRHPRASWNLATNHTLSVVAVMGLIGIAAFAWWCHRRGVRLPRLRNLGPRYSSLRHGRHSSDEDDFDASGSGDGEAEKHA